ncbi:MAG TPA: pyruvate kinase [Verrucomicrobiae bacterium]|nr:pyruvate kinase [Verrucomicrobiae bacterium]
MRELDKTLLQQLSGELVSLCNDMVQLESSLLKRSLTLHEANRPSARNLAHYLALRRHDVRKLQSQLASLGLSSLGRTEGHVFDAFQTVHHVLSQLLSSEALLPLPAETAIGMVEGAELLEKHTEALLGPPPPGRTVRIMVTMATEAATDYDLVRELVQSGMDCMRINCAHDNPGLWLGMIQNLQRARQETGRECRILMDIPGPKLRTGPIEPGAAVVKCRPERDDFGRIAAPARVWLTSNENPEPAPAIAAATLPLPSSFLKRLRAGATLRLRDARKAQRSLRITHVDPRGAWAETRQTIYFVPGLELQQAPRKASRANLRIVLAKARIGKLPHRPQTLLLKQGDTLVLTRANTLGRPALYDKSGGLLEQAQISVSLPQILDHAKVGDPVWFDDGKIGGVIRAVNEDSVSVEIAQARPGGEKLGAEKGINLPETQIDIPALTDEDSAALPFIVEHADLVGCSFVRTETHVRQLLDRIEQLGGQRLGLVLKIETRKAFENLPNLILAAMRTESLGIMIARGDLAVECGYQRLAEIQEEILWICEAAHVPVIWATQVLESLAKKGIPSRSEITDAAMGERAECVMLNKGPYAVMAVRVLSDILRRMQAHQEKKRSMLRQLRLAASFSND